MIGHRGSQKKQFALIIAIMLGLGLLFIIYSVAGGGTNSTLIREGGIIETLSAVGYFLCLFVMLIMGGFAHLKKYCYLYLLILALGLRELDFHDRFSTMGIFKLRFYTSEGIPGIERLIAVAIILLLLAAVGIAMKKHLTYYLKELRSFSPFALSLAIAFFLIVFSKSIDGLARKLRGISVEMSEQARQSAIILEEILELGIPLLLITAVLIHFSQQKTASAVKEISKEREEEISVVKN